MQLERSDIEAALEKKGFVRAEGDHSFFTYHTIRGAKTSVWTKTSHGTGYKTIGDKLVGAMARQCGLISPQFKHLVACPLGRGELESILLASGRIAGAREIVVLIRGGRKTIYDRTGHLRQLSEFSEKKDAKISRETWVDEASAKKAFFDGSVTWLNDTSSS